MIRDTGLAGRATVAAADAQAAFLWTGFLLVLGVGAMAGVLLPAGAFSGPVERVRRLLEGPPVTGIALIAGGLGAGIATLFSALVMDHRPPMVDALVQLVHARYVAAGTFAAPPDLWGPHWHLQNSVLTDLGWVSHYPPGHVVILGLGFLFGAAWMVGPALMGVTAFFSVLIGDRLFLRDPALGRFAGVLVAFSPFLLAHSGTYMNHATAAAAGTAAIYFGLRAREKKGAGGWAAAAGAALAVVIATRPLAGVVFVAVVAGGIWLRGPGTVVDGARWRKIPAALSRSGAAAGGGAPILAGLLLYNTRFFGAPLRFGYHESYGSAAGLGFGRDPWGNEYGPLEALAYTSADLVTLNLNLLETPVPAVVLVGAFLLLAGRLAEGERLLAIWAGLPVLANGFYWHHGYSMGPRMLTEFAPGWILLATAAAAGLARMLPDSRAGRARFSPRRGFLGLIAAGLVGMALLAPQRLQSYGGTGVDSFPRPPTAVDGGDLIFVHGSWQSRIVALLSTRGLGVDVVEAALRQNPTCLVHLHTLALEQSGPPFGEMRPWKGGEVLPALDLAPGAHEHRPEVRAGPGPPIRIIEGAPLAPECVRELRADRFGVLEATALFWRGDLPGIEEGRPMYVRDLGPERNREVLARYPDRRPRLFKSDGDGGKPALVDYEEGMRLLWGG